MKLAFQNVIDALMTNEEYSHLDPTAFVGMMCIKGYMKRTDLVIVMDDKIDHKERKVQVFIRLFRFEYDRR